jgi:hypothetical protein
MSTVDILVIVLLVVAAVLFALALLFNVPSRVNLIAGGLLAWVLASLIPAVASH